MAVISSTYSTDQHSQPGGGRWTVETHTDTEGVQYTIGPYLWDGVTDRNALLTARAAALEESLAASELESILGEE